MLTDQDSLWSVNLAVNEVLAQSTGQERRVVDPTALQPKLTTILDGWDMVIDKLAGFAALASLCPDSYAPNTFVRVKELFVRENALTLPAAGLYNSPRAMFSGRLVQVLDEWKPAAALATLQAALEAGWFPVVFGDEDLLAFRALPTGALLNTVTGPHGGCMDITAISRFIPVLQFIAKVVGTQAASDVPYPCAWFPWVPLGEDHKAAIAEADTDAAKCVARIIHVLADLPAIAPCSTPPTPEATKCIVECFACVNSLVRRPFHAVINHETGCAVGCKCEGNPLLTTLVTMENVARADAATAAAIGGDEALRQIKILTEEFALASGGCMLSE